MSLSTQYMISEISGEDLQIGIPVGFEADFSQDVNFHEINSRAATFNLSDPNQANKFFYSNNGSTWTVFKCDYKGVIFSVPYQIKVVMNAIDTGYLLVENGGYLNKVGSDLINILATSNINTIVSSMDIDNSSRDCFMLTKDSVIVANYDDSNNLKERKLSLLDDNVIGIAVDSGRKSFWQINSDSIFLRNHYGDILLSIGTPSIDIDISSSSVDNSETLIKKLNKFNGNLCFAAQEISDENYYIFEANRNGLLYSAKSSKNITSICVADEKTYYVTFENSGWIGKYSNGILTENYFLTALSQASQLEISTYPYMFILNKLTNILTKASYSNSIFTVQWNLTLPDSTYASSSNFALREDGYIIYTNNYNTYLISDLVTSAVIAKELSIGNGQSTFVSVVKNNNTSYVRIRQAEGEELGESSSSSISSKSASSSSSMSRPFVLHVTGHGAHPDPTGDYQAYGSSRYKMKNKSFYIFKPVSTWIISNENSNFTNYKFTKTGSITGVYSPNAGFTTGNPEVDSMSSESSSSVILSRSSNSSSSEILSRSSDSSEILSRSSSTSSTDSSIMVSRSSSTSPSSPHT